MASAIDDTKPIAGTPTTQSVRDNFTTAKSEITALQATVARPWTTGSVVFATATATLGQDNANLFWDNTNKRLAIGTAAPIYKLQIIGTSAAGAACAGIWSGPAGADTTTYCIEFKEFTGGITTGAIMRTGTNAVAYNTTSDARLKDDIVQSDRGLDALMQIKVSDYRMGETESQGLLAQDVHQVYPEAVHEGGNDPAMEPWMIDYGRLTPLLIRTIQQQQGQIEQLEQRLAAVEKRRH